jgi:succinyl-CoA synthetase beta subunit
MLNKEILNILRASKDTGWVLEPEAKRLLALAGLTVSEFKWTTDIEEAVQAAQKIGYPIVAKVVSPMVLHKTDVGGVAIGINSDDELKNNFQRFSSMDGFAGMLVEEIVSGVELIVGAKNDYQFGPVILLGIGGTGVEIYRDTAIRMAPLSERDVLSMVSCLKARPLIEGYRGADPVNMPKLTHMLTSFSEIVMELEAQVESIDLNPVMCSAESCVIVDARIMLQPSGW